MFDEINGLPVHPLVVHAAVVVVPLAGLLGVLFAIPRTRRWARIPLAVVSVGAVATVYLARKSGTELRAVLGLNGADSPAALIVREHAERASLLFIFTIAFAVLAVVALVVSAKAEELPAAAPVVLSILLVLGAGALAFQAFRVGESGSEAVWNPTGEQSYESGD